MTAPPPLCRATALPCILSCPPEACTLANVYDDAVAPEPALAAAEARVAALERRDREVWYFYIAVIVLMPIFWALTGMPLGAGLGMAATMVLMWVGGYLAGRRTSETRYARQEADAIRAREGR
jgi:hypothetical protein